ELVLQGFATEQHPESHLVASGEVDLSFPNHLGPAETGPDHRPGFGPPPRISHVPFIHHLGFDGRCPLRRTLAGMDVESDHLGPVPGEAFEIEGVERGGGGSGVDLGFDSDAEEGEGHPFPPADHGSFHASAPDATRAASQVVSGTAATRPIEPTKMRKISTATTSELATNPSGRSERVKSRRRGIEAPA